ncbi:MAG: hypothetical protein MZV63_23925 [Marinilabiliales bacterium]|nr:hypothetical protein [Marinilabiliales bacterium]
MTSPLAGRVIARDVIAGQHVHAGPARCSPCPTSPRSGRRSTRASRTCRFSRRAGVVRIRTTRVRGPRRGTAGSSTSATWWTRSRGRSRSASNVPNAGLLLKPNMFVQGEVAGAVGTREVLTVPADAVQTDQRRAGGVRARRPRTGFVASGRSSPASASGDRRVIAKGLDGIEHGGRHRRVQPQGRVAEVDAGGRIRRGARRPADGRGSTDRTLDGVVASSPAVGFLVARDRRAGRVGGRARSRSTPFPTSPTSRWRWSARAPGLSPLEIERVRHLPDRDGRCAACRASRRCAR